MWSLSEIAAFVERMAPADTAEEWDNVGVLVRCDEEITGVLCALEITPAVAEEAMRCGCNVIVCHHPVIFRPLRSIRADDVPALLVRAGISAVCAHTNLDKAPEGVNAALADALGLADAQPCGGFCWKGTLPRTMTAADLAAHVRGTLGAPVRCADAGKPVRTVGFVSGAGGDMWHDALAAGCDAFVTGEMSHHHALDALAAGMSCVVSTHCATERVIVPVLAKKLRQAFPGLCVRESETVTEPFTASV